MRFYIKAFSGCLRGSVPQLGRAQAAEGPRVPSGLAGGGKGTAPRHPERVAWWMYIPLITYTCTL